MLCIDFTPCAAVVFDYGVKHGLVLACGTVSMVIWVGVPAVLKFALLNMIVCYVLSIQLYIRHP